MNVLFKKKLETHHMVNFPPVKFDQLEFRILFHCQLNQ